MIAYCGVCNKGSVVTNKDRLYLPKYPELFICSLSCLEKQIVTLKLHSKESIREINFSGNLLNLGGGFKSDFEVRFYNLMKKKGFSIVYERYGFILGNSTWLPDFCLQDYGILIETKGMWKIGDRKKVIKFRELYPNISLIIVSYLLEKEIRKFS